MGTEPSETVYERNAWEENKQLRDELKAARSQILLLSAYVALYEPGAGERIFRELLGGGTNDGN